MASGTEISPQVTGFVGGCLQDTAAMSASAMEDHNADTLVTSNQTTTGKPPRNLSVMRHCTSSAFLCESVSQVLMGFFLCELCSQIFVLRDAPDQKNKVYHEDGCMIFLHWNLWK